MALFPGALPSAGTASASDTLAAAGHTSLHNTAADEARAIATKVGTGSSTPASSTVLTGTGAGTSSWAQVNLTTMVSGILPVANGGTGQGSLTGMTLPSAVLANPAISGTVTGGATYSSPVLTTPTIGSFTNAQHDHEDAAGGGQLGNNSVPDGTWASEKLNATIACKAYRNAAFNVTGGSGEEKIILDAVTFDLGGDWDTTNGRFTAPLSGYYQVNATVTAVNLNAAGDQVIVAIYANGVSWSVAKGYIGAAGNDPSASLSDVVYVEAGQYIEMYVDCTTTEAVGTGPSQTFMSIYFIGA